MSLLSSSVWLALIGQFITFCFISTAWALPDVVVTSVIIPSASTLSAGQSITFSAVVKNQGSTATPQGVVLGVSFAVDGVQQTWSDTYSSSLAPGASVTLKANYGVTKKGSYTAIAGAHVVQAHVNDINRFAESNTSNNKLFKIFFGRGNTCSGAHPSLLCFSQHNDRH